MNAYLEDLTTTLNRAPSVPVPQAVEQTGATLEQDMYAGVPGRVVFTDQIDLVPALAVTIEIWSGASGGGGSRRVVGPVALAAGSQYTFGPFHCDEGQALRMKRSSNVSVGGTMLVRTI